MRRSRTESTGWSPRAVFAIACLGTALLLLILVAVGVLLAGDLVAFDAWLTRAAPYALAARLVVYGVVGTLYVGLWRPRLRNRQQQMADGGAAGHARLIRIERMLAVVLILIEIANVMELIGG